MTKSHPQVISPVVLPDNQEDAAAKRVISQSWLLAVIVRGIIPLFRQYSMQTIMEQFLRRMQAPVNPGLTNQYRESLEPAEPSRKSPLESAIPGEGVVRFDSLFDLYHPGTDKQDAAVIANVDLQKYASLQEVKSRAAFYAARLLSSQLGYLMDNIDYRKLVPVYSIWICINHARKYDNQVFQYHLQEDNCEEKETSLLNTVIICLAPDVLDIQDPTPEQYMLQVLETVFTMKAEDIEQRVQKLEQLDIQLSGKEVEEVREMYINSGLAYMKFQREKRDMQEENALLIRNNQSLSQALEVSNRKLEKSDQENAKLNQELEKSQQNDKSVIVQLARRSLIDLKEPVQEVRLMLTNLFPAFSDFISETLKEILDQNKQK